MTEAVGRATRISGPDACRRILLVGELNPYGSDPRYALYHEPPNAAGGRLQRLIFGIEARRWYLPMWRVNLCDGSWSDDEATVHAKDLLDADGIPWRTVVTLGVRVAGAFARVCANRPPLFDSITVTRRWPLRVVTLPHPSGRNAAAWVPNNITLARGVMGAIAPDVPWGSLSA